MHGKKLCSLASELVGPPDRHGLDEIRLRLAGGRCVSVAFRDQSHAADTFYNDCSALWKRAAAKQGKAASIARKLEEMSKVAAERECNRHRSRSRSKSCAGPSRKRLLRRLNSVEAEGVYRVQHAQELSQERRQVEEAQERHIVVEHIQRNKMTRAEFIESLRKEAAMQAKILELQRAEKEERDRFDALRGEEERLYLSLRELQADDQKVSAIHATSDSIAEVPLPDGAAGQGEQAPPEQRSECVVCLTALRCTVFLPCKHLVCCEECGQGTTLQRCPMCRASIDWRFKVFL